MVTLQIQLLGDFQIRYQGEPLDGFEAPRLQSLLAYLLLHCDAPQSRKHLAFLLWQDSSEKQAHGNLRTLTHRLKQALPDADGFLIVEPQTLEWRADAPYTVDVSEFRERIAAAQKTTAPATALSQLSSAIDLYRGDLLPACYDEWLLPERERLRELFVDALAQLVAQAEAAHDYHAAIGYARRLIQADPLGEEAYRKLMALYARTGDRANMVRIYQTCVAVLKRELDTEPSVLTRQIFEQLRSNEFPIERAVVMRSKAGPNLPVPLTSFVGRTREVAQIRELLERARLLTLTGVGGCGKTRLAIRAGQEAVQVFSDGVWFVDFSPLSDPADVPRACANILGLREQAGMNAVEMLIDLLTDKQLLLIFDNCEHLLGACASLAQTLLHAAPELRILATSREPLNLLGEAVLIVPPLSLPDARHYSLDSLAHSDAVQLFAARASFILPSFRLNQGNVGAIAQICLRLDGIPLAIELAAARVRTLTPAQIAMRLDDALAVLTRGSSGVPARHQTMRAVLDWSDTMLAGPERTLFRRLSVFAGGFTLEAAELVCGAQDTKIPGEKSDPTILDLLSNLIDKSLVTTLDVSQSEEARYRLLEPVRQYAREKLQAMDEDQMWAARHLCWCIDLAEQMQPELEGANQAQALIRLGHEHDNLRGALEFALDRKHQASGLRLAVALERFWFIGGHPTEGRTWLKQLLALDPGDDPVNPAATALDPTLRARALAVAGLLAYRQNDTEEAEAYLKESLRVWQELDDQAGIALTLKQLGEVARLQGHYVRAVELMQQSLVLWRKLENDKGIANVLYSLGAAYSEQGDYGRAGVLYQEGLAIAQELGDLWLIAIFINNLGVAARIEDPERAETLFQETLRIRRGLGDQYGEAISLRNLAELALARKDWAIAQDMFQASLLLHQNMDNAKGAAECFVGLAWVEIAQGNADRAARLLGQSERLREMIHAPVPEDDRAEYEDLVSRVRKQMGEHSLAVAWAAGRALSMEQAVAYSLERPTHPVV